MRVVGRIRSINIHCYWITSYQELTNTRAREIWNGVVHLHCMAPSTLDIEQEVSVWRTIQAFAGHRVAQVVGACSISFRAAEDDDRAGHGYHRKDGYQQFAAA